VNLLTEYISNTKVDQMMNVTVDYVKVDSSVVHNSYTSITADNSNNVRRTHSTVHRRHNAGST